MYRIEFEPGDVGVFRSVDELATAIKSGVITPRARIYHQASDKWLPIEFHPHYRMALEMVANGSVHSTPPGPRPAIQHAPERPGPRPPVQHAPEPPGPPPAIQHAPEPPAAAIQVADPEPDLEPAPEPMIAEPAAEAAPEPPLEIFVPPRSREIRFIPVHDPAPRYLEPAAHLQDPAPVPLSPEPVAQPEAPVADTAPVGDAFYTPEESGRPAFGPRFRAGLSGKPGRPIALALAGAALILSGLSASATGWSLDVLGAGVPSLSFLHRNSSPQPEPKATAAAATRTARTPGDPEPQGSPSFGASSAFLSASHGASPAESKRGVAPDRAAPPAQLESGVAPESVVSSVPRASDIAVAAAKIPGLAPAVNSKLTLPVLVTRYEAAYAAATAELETGIRTAGFANVFAPEHLSSTQGIRAARLSAGTASAYVAKYRRREAEIEAAYADSATALVKSPADRRIWDGRHVLQESPEIAKLAGFLLQEIDSVFGVLSSQDGAYELKDGSITFQDAGAAHAYAELRPWLARQAHQWADTASGPPTTAARVLRAIGATKLPEGGAL
jgi:hypothetical protein